MKMILILSSLIFASGAFANCKEDFKYLQNRDKVKLVRERHIDIQTKRQMKYLIAPEIHAVKNYMSLMDFTFDGDNGLSITTEQYLERITDIGLGYRITITDGGDYSEVRYYLMQLEAPNGNMSFPILYRITKGQRRVSEYICE